MSCAGFNVLCHHFFLTVQPIFFIITKKFGRFVFNELNQSISMLKMLKLLLAQYADNTIVCQ